MGNTPQTRIFNIKIQYGDSQNTLKKAKYVLKKNNAEGNMKVDKQKTERDSLY